jgi:hypothetical protein
VGLARAVLWLSAAAFAAVGGAFLVAPASMGARVGLSLAGALADSDVRAVYGGLELGCAALLAYGALEAGRVRLALAAQLCLFGGLAVARAVSWLAAGWPGPLGVALHAAELAGLAAGWVARRRLP